MKTDLTVGTYIFHDDKVLLILHKKLKIWLPVGGHIEKDETPDDAVKRESREETNLEISLISVPKFEKLGNVITHLATPFYVNVHNVGDHHHVGFFYVSIATDISKLLINKEEVLDATWFTQGEVNESPLINEEVKFLCNLSFTHYYSHKSQLIRSF